VATAWLRFYEELNDFLPPERRKRDIAYRLDRRASVKDVIESLGVPHTEVDLILVDGRSVGFDHIVGEGERISVYPVFERLDIGPVQRLRPEPLRDPRFVCDANLGRLARYLRLLGFDTLYRNDYRDAEVARIAARERRILLSRDRRLLQRRMVTHGAFVHADDPREQAREVVRRFDLAGKARPFTRCTRCNGLLEEVGKAEILHRLEPKTREYYDRFKRCRDCGRIYWQGSHHERAQALVRHLLQAGPGAELRGRA
jgi:uncharacterized protein with PIN domain